MSFGAVVLAALVLVPLVEQLGDLVLALPAGRRRGETLLGRLQAWATERGLPTDFGGLRSDLITGTSKLASRLSQRVLGILGATVGITVNVVIVLVLAVFLLMGGKASPWGWPNGCRRRPHPGAEHPGPPLPGLLRRPGGCWP